MRIIARRTLRECWEIHPNARQRLLAWYADARRANWRTPADITRVYRNASVLPNNRVVFNIKGNEYRLVVVVQYAFGILYVRFVGSHADYDRIDAMTI